MINTKHLCKILKSNQKSYRVMWSRIDGKDYVSNGAFLVIFDKLPTDVLTTLFSVFHKVPLEDESLVCIHGEIQDEPKPIDWNSVHKPEEALTKGEKTAFLKEMRLGVDARIIETDDGYRLVNNDYMTLTDQTDAMVSGKQQPLYFEDGKLMLLPYRDTSLVEEEIQRVLSAFKG